MMELLKVLYSTNDKVGYAALQELEAMSIHSDGLYPCAEEFLNMLSHPKSFVRVRGFRLLCAQARWDRDGIIRTHILRLLALLNTDKPTAVRQYLASLQELLRWQPHLSPTVCAALDAMDLDRFRDTMRPLIEKDIAALKAMC